MGRAHRRRRVLGSPQSHEIRCRCRSLGLLVCFWTMHDWSILVKAEAAGSPGFAECKPQIAPVQHPCPPCLTAFRHTSVARLWVRRILPPSKVRPGTRRGPPLTPGSNAHPILTALQRYTRVHGMGRSPASDDSISYPQQAKHQRRPRDNASAVLCGLEPGSTGSREPQPSPRAIRFFV